MKNRFLFIIIALITMVTSCETIDDKRIPAQRVAIEFKNVGMWNTYGVHSYGEYRKFNMNSAPTIPSGFSYTVTSGTGFGGVILTYGLNFHTGEYGPIAYDMACPVERKQNVRIEMDTENLVARCPTCGSTYAILDGGGTALSGKALDLHYGLQRYQVIYNSTSFSYVITR